MNSIFNNVKTLFWSLKLLFKAAPVETVVLFVFIGFQGLTPAISLFALQGIVQWVGSDGNFPLMWLLLWGGMLFADVVFSPIITIVRLKLNEKMLCYCNVLLMEKANSFKGLDSFENSKIYDELQFLKNESSRRPLNFVYAFTGFFKDLVILVSVLMVLGTLNWWLPISILIACLPHAYSVLWFEKHSWDQMLFRSPESRKLAWIASLSLDEHASKEVRLFGFGNFLIQKYKSLAYAMHESLAKERWTQSAKAILLSTITIFLYVAIVTLVLVQTKNNTLEISGLVVVIQSLVLTQAQISSCLANLGMLTPILLFFSKFRNFLASNELYQSNSTNIFNGFNKEISFNNVSFSYFNDQKVISNVSFTISKGEKIAFVGQNGAGKSTLVKLLLRFYDPTEGSITVDGVNLKDIPIELWRSSISGIFQDFGRYHFTVGENISLSNSNASDEQINHAASKGGFYPILSAFKKGIHEPLGKEFGGSSLSGGEWQKLAMSRALLPNAELLVLDEPTSSLDPQSEIDVFNKFSEASQGKTTLFITHRLGSAKIADRILVLKNGRLIESGTHVDLLKGDTEYASLFNLQANLYNKSI